MFNEIVPSAFTRKTIIKKYFLHCHPVLSTDIPYFLDKFIPESGIHTGLKKFNGDISAYSKELLPHNLLIE
jgi:hypothetical protein